MKVSFSKIWSVISIAVVCTAILLFIYLLVSGSGEREYKYHNVVGKDTTAVFGDGKYEIYDINSPMGIVTMRTLDEWGVSSTVIMPEPEKYRVAEDIAYITGKEGFSVINTKTDLCKLYLYDTEHPMPGTKIVDDKDVVYLNSFDDFTSAEREQLKKTEVSEDIPNLIYWVWAFIMAAAVLMIASFVTVAYKGLKALKRVLIKLLR